MEEDLLKKREIVEFFLDKNIFISPDFLDRSTIEDLNKLLTLIKKKLSPEEFLVLNEEITKAVKNGTSNINWLELERSKVLVEKGKDKTVYDSFIGILKEKPVIEDVKILFSYTEKPKKKTVQDFVSYFNSRYNTIKGFLLNRQELQGVTSINRLDKKMQREPVALIAMVKERQITKNGNLLLEIEDPTGTTKVLVSKNKPELLERAKDIVHDEVIGLVGVNGDGIVFANNVIWPDIPMKKLKKAEKEEYVVFLSDFHVGSTNFLGDELNKFMEWINGKTGNEKQKEIASKVKYIFIAGDLVDGCGIYPGQENELLVKDIYEQYKMCAEVLKKIPPHIKLIICPGNHDAMRIAEPQPELYKDFAKHIWELPNVVMVSNPALVNIGAEDGFSGFDVLLYHGYSFDHFVANVDSIRNKGGYDRADLIMKFLLQRRHLAPTHTSTLYIPVETDNLVIDKIPDFFISGHIHKTAVANYKNITMVCGSCWQSKTSFQEKVGHHPEPCRVPIVNLKTRNVKILNFS